MDDNQIRNAMSGSPEMMSRWNKICDEAEQSKTDWISDLRKQGFKAAHPNDGWVDRKNKSISFTYPQFNDDAKEGDLVMLGQPNDKSNRPVRLLRLKNGFTFINQQWFFEDTEETNHE